VQLNWGELWVNCNTFLEMNTSLNPSHHQHITHHHQHMHHPPPSPLAATAHLHCVRNARVSAAAHSSRQRSKFEREGADLMRCSVTAGEDEGVGCVRSGWRCEDDSAWGDDDAKGMGLGGSKMFM
jgi:hypothetical protein